MRRLRDILSGRTPPEWDCAVSTIGGISIIIDPEEAEAEAVTLKYRDTEAEVVKAEFLAAIALQTGQAKDRERVVRLLAGGAIDRRVPASILEKHGLVGKRSKIKGGTE